MKKLIVGTTALGLVLGMIGLATAANTADHTVTVTVEAINEAAITGGNLTLTINTATAGQEPDDAVDNTSCDLDWTTNEDTKKITVETDLAAPTFTLKVLAQNVTGVGAAAAEVTLSTTPTNFVTGVAETTGGCDLQYTASATAAQGTGSDVHTVTYTLTDGP
jgi:rhamnose utilization protein RhaD (predicted bifunctional aldolase and dehydrogenase)